MNEVHTIGLDIAKNVFQAHGADASGRRDRSIHRHLQCRTATLIA